MAKKQGIQLDIAASDFASARVRLFTEFNKMGDAIISSLVQIPDKEAPKLTVYVSGKISPEQRNVINQIQPIFS